MRGMYPTGVLYNNGYTWSEDWSIRTAILAAGGTCIAAK